MNKRKNTTLYLTVLFLFLLPNLSIDFFHTENSIVERDFDCPACNFHNSSIATAQIDFFILPQLHFFDVIRTFCFINYQSICVIHPSSRSPPKI
jgi:hypothetical protein